jgi:hypothetical protein
VVAVSFFRGDDVVIRADDAPKGWTLLPDAADATPRAGAEKEIADAVGAALTAIEVTSKNVTLLPRSLTGPEGAAVTLAWVESFKSPKAVSAAVKEVATKKGWGFRELTAPSLLVIVAAPAGKNDEWVAVAVRVAAKRLGLRALDLGPEAAASADLARAALSLEKSNGPAHLALGLATKPGESGAEAKAWEPAIRELRAALATDLAIPLDAKALVVAQDSLGLALLEQKGGDDVNKEARDVLAKAWAGGQQLDPKHGGGLLSRYNLACAHARLKEIDAAFEHLTGLLEAIAKLPPSALSQLSDAWRADPDFEGLKSDPRWKALDAKYPASPHGDSGN